MRTIIVTIGMDTYCRTFQLFVEDDMTNEEIRDLAWKNAMQYVEFCWGEI